MASRTDIAILIVQLDIRALQETIKIVNRRRVDPVEMSRAAFCRVLKSEIKVLEKELGILRGQDKAAE